jgi:NAD(P)-dependent dehydrogenase (short-subunit alcohol dehydrogenase family)
MIKTWFVTGATRGLGYAWVEAMLERGDRVTATGREIDRLDALAKRFGKTLLPIRLDITERDAVFAALCKAKERFGHLDVVVANAGYGLFGTIEETSEQEARAQFEANFFGTLWTVQAAIPLLRGQQSGHVMITTSLAGVITFPTAGVYNATKWAVEAVGETLAKEVADFGIVVTLIEPGSFATDWNGSSASHATHLAEYGPLRARMATAYGNRPRGEPKASAKAVLAAADAATPPLRLFLGPACLPAVKEAYSSRMATWEKWREISDTAAG